VRPNVLHLPAVETYRLQTQRVSVHLTKYLAGL
jgi:hypothetical protein